MKSSGINLFFLYLVKVASSGLFKSLTNSTPDFIPPSLWHWLKSGGLQNLVSCAGKGLSKPNWRRQILLLLLVLLLRERIKAT